MSMRYWPCLVLAAAVLLHRGYGPAQAQSPQPPAEKKAKLVQRTYSVADLVIPVDNTPHIFELGGKRAPAPDAPPASPTMGEEKLLIEVIKNTVAPQSWSSMGGPGSIDYFPLGMALVVKQTPKIHKQLADLLAALRRLQENEVAVEVRFVTISESLYERIGVSFDLHEVNLKDVGSSEAAAKANGQILGYLTEAQVFQLFEQAQSDRRTTIMQAPKMTLFNGQSATVAITDEPSVITCVSVQEQNGRSVVEPKVEKFTTGVKLAVQPIISADRRYVQLRLAVERTGIEMHAVTTIVNGPAKCGDAKPTPNTINTPRPQISRFAIDRTFTVPDGGTVILGGWKETCPRRDKSVSHGLVRLPVADRLFDVPCCKTPTPRTVLLLVTPRVIVPPREIVMAPVAVAAPMPKGPVLVSRPTPERVHGAEESEAPPAPTASARDQRMAKVLAKYERACRAGDVAAARKYAIEALALDPTCFGRKSPPAP